MIDGAGDLDARRLELVLEAEQILAGTDGEGDVIETLGIIGRGAMGLALHRPGLVIFEERHLVVAELEEIVAEALVTDAGHQLHAQQVAVKADGLLEIIGDEGQMVDALEQHGVLPFPSRWRRARWARDHHRAMHGRG